MGKRDITNEGKARKLLLSLGNPSPSNTHHIITEHDAFMTNSGQIGAESEK